MNWTAVSAICDVIAATTVVVSLLYVAVQLRQNTRAIVASSRHSVLDGDIGLISDYIAYGIDPHLIGDDVVLSPQDERRFTWIVIKALRIREFAWHQHQLGMLDDETWESYLAPVPGIFSTMRARIVLDFYTGSPDFQALIRQRVYGGDAPAPPPDLMVKTSAIKTPPAPAPAPSPDQPAPAPHS